MNHKGISVTDAACVLLKKDSITSPAIWGEKIPLDGSDSLKFLKLVWKLYKKQSKNVLQVLLSVFATTFSTLKYDW